MANKLNLSYIAGFFDGEGCISLSLSGLRLIITNTDRSILEDIKFYFNGRGQITSKMRTVKDRATKPCWQLIYWNKQAEKVLIILAPFLRQKEEQARLALQFQKTYMNRNKGKKMTEEVLGKRKMLINEIKEVRWRTV